MDLLSLICDGFPGVEEESPVASSGLVAGTSMWSSGSSPLISGMDLESALTISDVSPFT